MGNGNGGWVALAGLVSLAALTFTGMVGGLLLANNGHEVPQWLSSTITGLGTNFGIVVLVVYQRTGNGSSTNGNGRDVAYRAVPDSAGLKVGEARP